MAKAEEQQFQDTPRGLASRYSMEFAAAKKHAKSWQHRSEDAVARYRDDRDASEKQTTRWNFYPTNINMKLAVLYGRPPEVSVTRRFEDANDELARVSCEMAERLLNTDLQRDTDDYATTLHNALFDRLTAGIGIARERYVETEKVVPGKEAKVDPTTGDEMAPAVPESSQVATQEVETIYCHWQDALWSSGARVFGEVRWFAFREAMKRAALVERFGEDVGGRVPLNTKKPTDTDKDPRKSDPWARADVWEIWDKEFRRVVWYVEGFGEILDVKEDPYQLDCFWPFALPMVANLSTADFAPMPDYALCKDIYAEIDDLSERITLLEEAVVVRGAYDKNAKELKDLIGGARRNQMIPVPNWGAFAEKGGFKGVMEFMPLDQVVMAMDKLRDYRQELISTVAQLDGSSDIVRGQQMENGTPGEAQLKAKYAGIRMQQIQEEFAKFASDLQQIRFELIAKFWDIETIITRANAHYTMDAQMAVQAAQFIKDKHNCYRIEIEPDSLAQADMANLKQERTEWLGALSGFLQSAMPMAQAMPGSMPMLLELLKWTMASLKGSASVGGILDEAIAQAKQMAQQPQQGQPPPQDPRLQTVMAKGQLDMQKGQQDIQKIQAQAQSEIMRINAETQALAQRRMTDASINVKEEQAKQHIKNGGFGMMPPGGV